MCLLFIDMAKYNQKDITGKTFNHLTALRLNEKRTVHRKSGRTDIEYYWDFRCDCGRIKCIRRDRVTDRKNPITACGCRQGKRYNFTGFKNISGAQWSNIKKGARLRNLAFNISIEEAWDLYESQNRKCALTGEIITFSSKNPWYKETTASLDRIDNTKGYIRNNVQWVHKKINIFKLDHSVQEFVELCEKVTKHHMTWKGDSQK